MTQQRVANAALGTRPDGTGRVQSGTTSSAARRLLACGVAAGPLVVAVALVQALTRPGFALTRDAVSLLDDGSWGLGSGHQLPRHRAAVHRGRAGLRRAIPTGPGSRRSITDTLDVIHPVAATHVRASSARPARSGR